ncbi:hypothetical protein JJJ17_04350 [Paracoccus caeni]|uniref:Uncharacterized protein n=1 Tax=Paracoccus caeni TaxID=657651 RepID=A0A934SAE4_9RHOB|nr:hypothetical protein [Paracoccus caeni]MBK4215151.1 hypothetical protein [Paracoccus caeni]
MMQTGLGLMPRLGAMLMAVVVTLIPIASGAQQLAALRASDAMKYFDAICGGTLPNFENAPAALQQNGFQQYSTGTWYLPDQSVSIKIIEGPGMGRTCSFVANSTDGEAGIKAAVAASLPGIDQTAPGLALYPKTQALVQLNPQMGRMGDVTIFGLQMLSDRK